MEQRLTATQLQQVVAEVQQLSLRRDAELDAVQVREILQELNLPPELLEDALVQLRRREALNIQQRRNRWIGAGIAIALSLLAIGVSISLQRQQQTLDRVVAQSDRLTLAADNGGNLQTIARQANGEVVYRVTLNHAPVGDRLSLSCDWIDPKGKVVHQNRYQTKAVTTPVWNTACRYSFGTVVPIGNWQVKSFIGDRLLSQSSFEVK